MGPLIKITSDSMRLIRITEHARLLPSDSADLERRKAIARRLSAQGNQGSCERNHVPLSDIARINRTFSHNSTHCPPVSPSPAHHPSREFPTPSQSPAVTPASVSQPSPQAVNSNAAEAIQTTGDIRTEARSSYTEEKGSFEMRVTRGDVTYVPALTMTIVTQMPELHFEYLGGFNYVPPQDGEGSSETINLHT